MNHKASNKLAICCLVYCLSLLFLAVLSANDTKVTVAAGGIVIENQEPDIEMVSEKLEVSTKKIRVSYDFFNHGQVKKISVGFPLPRSPYDMEDSYPYATWDEPQIALRALYGDDNSPSTSLAEQLAHAEIIDFSVLVNDKPVQFERHIRAHDPKGNDITDLLKKNRIPISSAYLRGFLEMPPMDLLPGLKDTLKELGLLDYKGRPSWYLQTTYTWQQEFAAKKNTHVQHSYTPSKGLYWIDIKAFDDRKNLKDHRGRSINLDECTFDSKHLEKSLNHWRQAFKKLGGIMPLYEVQYILKTGANWRGPIGKFHLEIKPDKPRDLVIVEGKYPMKRQKNGVCVIELKNFKPTDDLRVWIIPFDMDQSIQKVG